MLRIDGRLHHGWADYNDAASASVPIVLVADTWTTLANDGLGAFTNKAYLPPGVTSLLDAPSGNINVTQLKIGDTILVRTDYIVTQSTNNSLLEFRYQLGTGGAAYTLDTVVNRLDAGTVRAYRFSLRTDMIYMGDLNTRDNPITPQICLSGPGSVVNAGVVIQALLR